MNAIEHVRTINDNDKACCDEITAYHIAQHTMLNTVEGGGELRQTRGNVCETMIDIVCRHLGIESRIGDDDCQTITIIGRDGVTYTRQQQLDRHLYFNKKLIAVIECKAYLDSCYYVRACNDFKRMSIKHPTLKKYVFALENAIADDAVAFTDVDFNYVCDKIFYMCDGKRSSSKPIYKKEFAKPINIASLRAFIQELRTLIC